MTTERRDQVKKKVAEGQTRPRVRREDGGKPWPPDPPNHPATRPMASSSDFFGKKRPPNEADTLFCPAARLLSGYTDVNAVQRAMPAVEAIVYLSDEQHW
jgi:hypothetical protein